MFFYDKLCIAKLYYLRGERTRETMVKSLLTMTDHDILITLVETVKNNHTNVMEKIEGVKNDVRITRETDLKEIKDGTQVRLAEHDVRIRTLEKLANDYKPEPLAGMIKAHEQWIHDFRLTWKFVLGVSIAISTIIGFVLGTVSDVITLFAK